MRTSLETHGQDVAVALSTTIAATALTTVTSTSMTSGPTGADASAMAATMLAPIRGSDAWRVTSYGFVHDDEHALIAPFPDDSAMEVTFLVDLAEQFDQAGVFVRGSDRRWIKAGIEFADGKPQLGAVVTDEFSDWSVAPVSDWNHRRATIRASRSGDALTVRARLDDGPWQLVRLAHLAPGEVLGAGPFCCAPTRGGLVVRFLSWESTPSDTALH